MAKTENKRKTGFLSDVKVFFRTLKISYKLDRPFFWMQLVNAMGNEVRPLINSILAALIINGLYAGKSEKTLILYAVIVVFVNFLINLEVLFTANRRYIRKSMWYMVISLFFNSYSERMDYAHFEDAKVKDLRRKIDRNIRSGRGISDFWAWYFIVSAVSGIAASVAILGTMITQLRAAQGTETVTSSFVSNPRYIVIVFAVLMIAFWIAKWSQQVQGKLWKEVNDFWSINSRKLSKMQHYTTDTKLAMDMNIYGLDGIIKENVEDYIKKGFAFNKKIYFKEWLLECYSLIGGTGLAKLFATIFVGSHVVSGAFGIGSFVLFTATLIQFSSAISNLASAIGRIRGNRPLYDDELGYIDMENEMKNGTEHPSDKEGHVIEFCDVSFRYPESDAYALRHVNFRIGSGERVAIVGMNGSGKTTFIKLLCRLYDPTEGTILLDGKDIREYNYEEYLQLFSVVFQDFKLFAFPLAENVAAGRNYDPEKVRLCLSEAGMEDRLATLPKGLETCIYKGFDPEGVEISGGEAQKIALARALYKDAPFVILDEPTAALDPLAEAEVYSHFNEMVSGKTAVYISHRLSSCRFCTRIAVFDKGSVVQYGEHDELLADESGKYHELWYAQAQYYH